MEYKQKLGRISAILQDHFLVERTIGEIEASLYCLANDSISRAEWIADSILARQLPLLPLVNELAVIYDA